MGLAIAFSGPGNTGKSTLISKANTLLSNEGYDVRIFGETARDVMGTLDPGEDIKKFQEEISAREYVRAYNLNTRKDLYDIILVDRTFMDNLAYYMFNVQEGKIGGETKIHVPELDPYDEIIYFDTPIKETRTKAFSHYNQRSLDNMMRNYVKGRFGKKVKLYQNGKIDGDRVIRHIKKLLGNR